MAAPLSGTVMAELSDLLRENGIHHALGYLNARTRFRFTGVYRADPPLLRNVHLFDRENPGLDVSGGASPFGDVTPAARNSILSYAGVPIRLRSGCLLGSICHFDLRLRFLADRELTLLESVAPIVGGWLGELSDQ
jgi:GAF domain-containing protein